MRTPATRIVAALFSLALFLPAAANAGPLSQMDWLANGTWTAQLAGGRGHIELRYDSVADGALLRFQTAFVDSGGAVTNRYAGDFYADPASSGIKMWYIDSHGEITQGTVAVDGMATTLDFTQKGDDGTSQVYRVVVMRRGDDRYDWTLFVPDGAAYKKLFGITYNRTP